MSQQLCGIGRASDYGETPPRPALVGDVTFKLVRVITQTRVPEITGKQLRRNGSATTR